MAAPRGPRPRRWLVGCAAAAAALAAPLRPAHAHEAPSKASTEYITYCAEVASTTQILTPQCADGYATLGAVVSALLASPGNFTQAQLGALNGLCATSAGGPSCVTQMRSLAELYVDGLPPPLPPSEEGGKDTCEGTLAPNAKALFGTLLPYVCRTSTRLSTAAAAWWR
jgi:hypothetical protein